MALTAVFALSLGACSSGDSDSSESSDASTSESGSQETTAQAETQDVSDTACQPTEGEVQFPLEIEHAYGTTTIEKQPERVATVSWGNHEVPLALGVVPVGMTKTTWGDDDDNGVLPWVEDKLTELGAETPALFDETDSIPYEEVEKTNPDVILASSSGLSQEDYDKLSKIAPVVAYPGKPWQTTMECMIRMNSKAIGKSQEGEQLISDLDARVNEALDAHPDIKGKTVLFSGYDNDADLSKISFYTTGDTRAAFLKQYGFGVPAIVDEESKTAEEFYVEVSAEDADRFDDVDVIVSYGSDDLVKRLQDDPLLSNIPAIKEGRIALLENETPQAAMASPSPLGLPWGIDNYFGLIEEAANKSS